MSQIKLDAPAKSRKPDARLERTRQEFRAALVRLLDTQEFDEIRVRDIAGEAGQGYATFFRHYSDKADLLDDVIQHFLAQVRLPTASLLKSRQGLLAATAICELIDENRALSKILLTGGASATVHRQFVRQAVEFAETQAEAKDNSLPGNLGITYPVNAIMDILSWWLGEMPKTSVAEVAQLIDHLVLTPIIRYK